MDNSTYDKLVKKHTDKEDLGRNMLISFLFGGALGVLGNFMVEYFDKTLKMSSKDSISLMVIILIFIAALLTGLGVFDKLMGIFKAGLLIPITGFAHSVTSAAMEYKREGFIQGIGSNMLKLAGSVIEYGIVTAYFLAMILYLLGVE